MSAARVPLYDPAEHEPLGTAPWDPDRARAGIDAIAGRALAARGPDGGWPRHPEDDYGQQGDCSLWIGAAGTLWALEQLGRGLGEAGLYERWRASPDVPGSRGLMLGETGVALVSWRLSGDRAVADRLAGLVAETAHAPDHELFSGAPGTMLAALHMHERTGEPGWADLWRSSALALLDEFRTDPEYGCRLWIQYRRGRLLRSLGAGHGFCSNVRSLLRGRALLGPGRSAELERAAAATAAAFALRDTELVNWPTAADPHWAEQFPIRLQWCHGAPGFLTSLWTLPRDPELDALLTGAGELVWRAGPLRKGPGLCHGTAGNGCGLLALYARTGEERWLSRARAFAMHALAQVEAGSPRHSLWTGAPGVALYLAMCLDGRFTGMPVIDVL